MGWRRLAGHWLLSDYDLALDLGRRRSEEHTSELQSRLHLVCRLLLEKKKSYVYLVFRVALKPGPCKRYSLFADQAEFTNYQRPYCSLDVLAPLTCGSFHLPTPLSTVTLIGR